MINPEAEPIAPTFWRLPLLVALLAVAVRVALIIVYPDGRDDLGIYTYYAGLIVKGLNPYVEVHNAPVQIQHANHTFLSLAIFANVLKIWNSPVALRLLFAFIDGVLVLTIGYAVRRSRAWRRFVMFFYALNPFVLMATVIFSVDKGIILWMVILVLISIEAQRQTASVLATTLVTLYRWIGTFFILPVALYFARTWRGLILSLGLFGAAFALAHVPYWPFNLWVYVSRAARLGMSPTHDSPTMLLAALHLYSPRFPTFGMVATVAIFYTLFVLRKVSLVEVVVLSTMFTNVIVPDLPANRVVLVSIPLFWLMTLNRPRMIVLWVATTVAAPFANPYETDKILQALHLPIHLDFPSIPHMLLINLMAIILFSYYLIDKRRGRVSRTTLLPEDWLLARWELWRKAK